MAGYFMSTDQEKQSIDRARVLSKLYISSLVLLLLVGGVGFLSNTIVVIHDALVLKRKKTFLEAVEKLEFTSGAKDLMLVKLPKLTEAELAALIANLPDEKERIEYREMATHPDKRVLKKNLSELEWLELGVLSSERILRSTATVSNSGYWGDADYRESPFKCFWIGSLCLVPALLLIAFRKWMAWLLS